MTGGLIIVALLAIAVAAFVIAPILRSDAGLRERLSAASSEFRDLQSKHDMLLASLKDLEDDYATAKIGDEDYRELRDRLSGETIEVMKRLDELNAPAKPRGVPSVEASADRSTGSPG